MPHSHAPVRSLNLAEVPADATLNLGVTTMIAYVSGLTNGRSEYTFIADNINQLAEKERIMPLKPILDDLFGCRSIIVCQSAYNMFTKILFQMAGPTELVNAQNLMKLVNIVPDVVPDEMQGIKIKGGITYLNLIIFATGYAHSAVTVTANQYFIRAVESERFKPYFGNVFVHQPRSLSERSEIHDDHTKL